MFVKVCQIVWIELPFYDLLTRRVPVFRVFILFLCFISVGQADDYLTLHIIRSPNGLDWSRPRSLARTVVSNALSPRNRMIGHVAVELNCEESIDKKRVYELTGMINSDSSIYSKQILFKRLGFGVLFDTYRGELESREELVEDITQKRKQKRRNRYTFIKHLISPSTCERLATYLSEYRENNFDRFYGLPLDPRKKEGAGCSAFGISFLELGGLMREEFEKNWSYDLKVPSGLIGGDFYPDDDIEKVGLFNLYFLRKSKNRWAVEGEDYKSIFFWDPDSMYNWTQTRIKKMDYPRAAIARVNKSFGLIIDAREVATPTEPIWKEPFPEEGLR